MNTIGIALVWCVVQVTLVGLLAAGLYLMVRRLRPAAAASVVLTGLAIVVVLSLLVLSPWPRWTIGSLASSTDRVDQALPDTLSSQAQPDLQVSPLPRAAEGQGVKAVDVEAVSVNNQPSGAAVLWQALLDELAKPQATAPTSNWHWPAVMAVLLLAAMACGLGWLMLGVAAVRWQRLRSRPVVDGELLELINVLRAELGCQRPVEARQSDDLVTPATIGWRRPVLLLPADWTTWTADQRRAVLAHEIVHARSHDFIALLVGQLGLALHFYHPLLHWLIGRLRLEQELAADAAAASVSGGQRQYLTTIAELALRQQDRPLLWPARSFLPTRTTFLRRIAMLRDSKLRFDRLSPATRLTTVGAVLLCGLLVAGLRRPGSPPQATAADAPAAVSAQPLAQQPQAPADEAAIAAARKILDNVAATYKSLETFKAEGTVTVDMDTGSTKANIETSFSIALKKPNVYLISWAQKNKAMPDMVQSGTVWSDGTQPYLYMGVLRTYSKMSSDAIALGGATGISGGAAFTIPSLFLSVSGLQASFSRLIDPKIEKTEKVEEEDCYVISGASMISKKETFWISKSKHLIVKYSRLLTPPAGGMPPWAFNDEQIEQSMRGMGLITEENKKQFREQMARSRDLVKNMKISGSSTELYVKIASPALKKEDFVFVPPKDAVLKDSLFGGFLSGAMAQNSLQKTQSQNNMKMIALAMHNYAQANRRFPPAVLCGPDGKTPYSWRVALLPYLELDSLYKQYHFDEPWDGPNNRKLLDTMVAVFHCPTEPAGSKNASYFVLVGPGTMFDGKEGTSFAQIVDGASNTILVVEAKRDIPWTKPEDIPYDPDKPLPKLGGYFEGGFNAALADGSVQFFPSIHTEKGLRALITKADKQPANVEHVITSAQPPRPPAARTGGKYTASAFLRVAMQENPPLPPADVQRVGRDRFEIDKNTQRQLLLSRFVLVAALRDPELAKLLSVQRATETGDAVGWLMSQLQVSFSGNAEIMQVSLSSADPKEAATLVNVVVNTYLKEVVNDERDKKQGRLKELDRVYTERETEVRTKREELKADNPDIEKLRADIKKLDTVLTAIAKEREKLKADLRVAPPVTLLKKAEVPEMPGRLDVR